MTEHEKLELAISIKDALVLGLFFFAVTMLLWFLGMLWAEAPSRAYWRQRELEWDREEEEEDE